MDDDLRRLADDAGGAVRRIDEETRPARERLLAALARTAPVLEAGGDAARRALDAAADAIHEPPSQARAPGDKPRAIGVNHVALEVGDVDEALAFYGSIFALELRGRVGDHHAFVDLGDQFIALSAPRSAGPDEDRHFGLVVDDAEAVRRRLDELGVPLTGGGGLDFHDPWGNRVQVVQYDAIQFTKAPAVLRGMGLRGLRKSAAARDELREKGLG